VTQPVAEANQPLLKSDLVYAEDIFESIGDELLNKFAVFETILFEGKDVNTARKFDKTLKMSKEGVYATYFVFSRVKNSTKVELEPEVDTDDILGYLEDIFGSFFTSDDSESERLLRASNEINLKNPHLIIRGSISYLNSFGYLNAEEYPML
jgi:hypothetical protein